MPSARLTAKPFTDDDEHARALEEQWMSGLGAGGNDPNRESVYCKVIMLSDQDWLLQPTAVTLSRCSRVL